MNINNQASLGFRLIVSLCPLIASFATGLRAAERGWLPDGFEKVTFARPPEVTYPAGLAVSPLGEVFVSVDLNSSLDTEPNRGKIVRAVDTDGDGVADQFNDFVPNIDSPRGSTFAGDTLYVVHPPFLSAFRDTDGDGVGEQEVLISGLGFELSFRGADHTSNGVRMGIDGWLYLAIGDYGFFEAVGKDGRTLHLHGGGVVRIRPDGTELEPYTLYTRNIYDVAISPTLDLFSRDNTNDGKGWNTRLHHLIALADQGYPRLYKNFADETMMPLADYGGGSGTGAYYLDEPGFPERFNDKLYTLDFTTSQVYLHSLEQTEATYRVEQESFYGIKAIDMDVDGFSRIYVSDWEGGAYNYRNTAVGSITMITYPEMEGAKFPDLANASEAELLNYIVSDSAVARINTQQEILKRGPNDTFRVGLETLAASSRASLYGRIAALFTMKQLFGVESHAALLRLVEDDSIREFALRALADRKSEIADVPSAPFVAGLSDDDPRVRLQSVIGIERLGDSSLAGHLLPLAVQPPDPAEGYGNNRAIPHIAKQAIVGLQAVDACLAALDNPALRNAALRSLQEMHISAAVDGLIGRLETVTDVDTVVGVLQALFRLYNKETPWDGERWWTTRPDDRGPYFEPVLWEQSAKIKSAIESYFPEVPNEFRPEMVLEMRKNRIDPATFELNVEIDEVLAMIESPRPGDLAVEPLKLAAQDKNRPDETRLEAFQALGRIIGPEAFEAQLDVLESWYAMENQPELFQRAAKNYIFAPEHATRMRLLRDGGEGYRLQLKLMICMNLADSPLTNDYTKGQAEGVLRENERRLEFIRAVGEMRAVRFRAIVAGVAESGQGTESEIAREALAMLDTTLATDGENGNREIADLTYEEALNGALSGQGDVQLGQQLFSRQACVACHTLSQDEPQKGPYLGDAGSKWSREALIQSVLQPSAVVAQGFQTQWFEMEDGSTQEGFVTGESDGKIELRNIAGIATQLSASEIQNRGLREQSMMPEGLAANLTVHEFTSLIDYLKSLH